MVTLADRSTELNPDFLSEVVLYALSAADLTMLVVLVFVLARNIVKLIVERRRGLPFSRFRAKLVLAMLGLTIVPSVLVLIVGGELIRSSTERWLSAPIDDVLRSVDADRRRLLPRARGARRRRRRADRRGGARRRRSPAGDAEAVRRAIAPEVDAGPRRRSSRSIASSASAAAGPSSAPLVGGRIAGAAARARRAAAADLLAARVAGRRSRPADPRAARGRQRAGARRRDRSGIATGAAVGVVIASDHLSGELATHARRITEAYEEYNSSRVMKRPLQGIYLSLFLTMTLMILVSATWMGLYLAKRITRPVQRLAAGAREIGAGHLDHRIEPETRDEFGSLVEAFNTMAGGLAASQQKLERSRLDLEQQEPAARRAAPLHRNGARADRDRRRLDGRRRADRNDQQRRAAAARRRRPGHRHAGRRRVPARQTCSRSSRSCVMRVAAPRLPPRRSSRSRAKGASCTSRPPPRRCSREDGSFEGAVLVFDDVTPLIRTQRVAAWRDVARRLAHEIKNPLTPIQLCAERMRRHFSSAQPTPARELVEECTTTIVGEVESLKELVDEFAQFARMPAPRVVPADLNALLAETLALYNGLFRDIRLERRFADGLPPVRVDVEQIRRVVINLVDNAVEALGGAAAPPRGRTGIRRRS